MTGDIDQHSRPLQAVPDTTPPPPPRWSAVQAARESGVARSTIHEALKSGRLRATKDDNGAWRITPHALIEAGFRPGTPTKSPQDHVIEDRAVADEEAPVPAEVARLRVEVIQAQLDGERRLREIVERQLLDVVQERDRLLHRQLEAAPSPSPVAPVAPPHSAPDPTPAPAPDSPSEANVGRWRRAVNVLRYG